MVCSELHLESVHRDLAAGQRHYSRVVDQEIKGLSSSHPLREVGDRCEARQIEMFVARPGAGRCAADLFDRRLSLPIVPTGYNDVRTGPGERQRSLEAETAGGTR